MFVVVAEASVVPKLALWVKGSPIPEPPPVLQAEPVPLTTPFVSALRQFAAVPVMEKSVRFFARMRPLASMVLVDAPPTASVRAEISVVDASVVEEVSALIVLKYEVEEAAIPAVKAINVPVDMLFATP